MRLNFAPISRRMATPFTQPLWWSAQLCLFVSRPEEPAHSHLPISTTQSARLLFVWLYLLVFHVEAYILPEGADHAILH